MKTKLQIISEIKKLATKHGKISFRAFCRESGMSEHQILGVHWAKWNDALQEAGVGTGTFFREKADDAVVVQAFAQLILKLGKWPTENELKLARRLDKSVPSIDLIRRVRDSPDFGSLVLSQLSARSDLVEMIKPTLDAICADEGDAQFVSTASISGYVYLMKSGQRHKIGRTNSPSRRYREIRIELPDPTLMVHTIATDDPEGVEAYWHKRFQSKRVRDTEFFELGASDVASFKRWKRIA